jgi:hypothetical protein
MRQTGWERLRFAPTLSTLLSERNPAEGPGEVEDFSEWSIRPKRAAERRKALLVRFQQ